MDVRKLSVQSLFIRTVTLFFVAMAMKMTGVAFATLAYLDLFTFCVIQVVIFSLLLVIFYMIMVQYLMKKTEIPLFAALLAKAGSWAIGAVSLIATLYLFTIFETWGQTILLWLAGEIAVLLAQWLMPGRRNRHDG